MKLGVLLDRLDAAPGGAEVHTLALVQRAVGAGDEVVLATLTGSAPAGVEAIAVPARGGRPERDQAFAREGERRLREAGCDVVYAIRHAPACDVYLPHGGLVDDARAAKDRAAGGPGLLTRIGRAFSRKHAFFLEAERALLAGETGPTVIAVSDLVARRIEQRYPRCARRLATVRNGVDADRFERAPFVEAARARRRQLRLDATLLGLLLARHPVLKGVETAIRALAEPAVRELERPFALVVTGGRLPARLRRLAARLRVADRLHVLPAAADPRPLYAAVDLLVHPTWYDPCSLVCLEALAMELPVITTPPNGVREIMGQRGGIVIEEPGNPAALAAAIRVLADDRLRAATAQDARRVALANRASTRLDRVLDLCRAAASRG